jgi:hypothetical protein
MRISFTQSGGFAGLVRGCHIDTATLPPDDRRTLELLVEASRISGEHEALSGAGRDLRQYEIVIEHVGGAARLCCDERSLPESVRPLVADLMERSSPQAPHRQAVPGEGFLGVPGRGDPSARWGRFEGEVVARWSDGGRDMTLVAPFAYVDPQAVRWDAPTGSVVDGASIPRAFWSLVGGPFTGRYRAASVVHDVACATRERGWQQVHRMFFDACRCGGVGRIQATGMYYAVYHFGPRWTFETRATVVGGRPTMARVAVDVTPPQPTDAQAAAVMAYVETHDVAVDAVPALVIPGSGVGAPGGGERGAGTTRRPGEDPADA